MSPPYQSDHVREAAPGTASAAFAAAGHGHAGRAVKRENMVPDCCNIGIVFRSLLFVNGAVLAAILLRTDGLAAAGVEFLESAVLVELACLSSLALLCGVRQVAGRLGGRGQRVVCILAPAAATGLIIHFLSGVDWLWSSFRHLTVIKGMLAAALMAGVLQHYFALRMRAFSPALVEARLQALQARIRPHFLFNSLNAVLSLIRSEPRRAESTLEDLADLFRVLMSDPRGMTSLEEEIRLSRQYLSIEQIRLGDRLQVEWKLDGMDDGVLRAARMPVLLLQPLIENAVHHGVEPAASPMTIRVRIGRSIDRIQIVIVNPYHGATAAESGNQLALNNIRERLALLYDVEAELATTVNKGLFEVRLRFPYSTNDA
jgi:two-component system sensor histidine kinase AlgZ